MLMSKSRLEKFLYALYSLDSSDLPTPLSRIEELYKCWVAGEEVSTFKPLSRVEKYLMSILGVYDVELLPNPLSRVEVLLHKLATGDDNLDDVKSFLSEHEESLAEIIRNGGTGGNIDIEYVLYTLSAGYNTLYNTAEKPIESAILKGNTLVNLVKKEYYGSTQNGTSSTDSDYVTVTEANEAANVLMILTPSQPLEANTLYTLVILDKGLAPSIIVRDRTNAVNLLTAENSNTLTFTTTDKPCGSLTLYYTYVSVGQKYKHSNNVMIFKGDVSNLTFKNHFTGMQSVKMPVLTTTGKNLWCYGELSEFGVKKIPVNLPKGTYFFSGEPTITYAKQPVIVLHGSTNQKQYNYINQTITTDFDIVEIVIYSNGYNYTDSVDNLLTINNFMMEQGNKYIAYEPYKSNILTTNEEVELRGIGNVRDELNLLTGELTQRVGEIVVDGSRYIDVPTPNIYRIYLLDGFEKNDNPLICDKMPTTSWQQYSNPLYDNYVYYTNSAISFIQFNRTLEEFKEYIRENPVTLQYQFATESVKTVDLSVVNQDGNNTKLSTFNDITHVTLSSEGLIPESELKVATKNEEVLNTMSLEMDDISKTQNDLQETLDAQSENVDSTMIATTEIYEGLL